MLIAIPHDELVHKKVSARVPGLRPSRLRPAPMHLPVLQDEVAAARRRAAPERRAKGDLFILAELDAPARVLRAHKIHMDALAAAARADQHCPFQPRTIGDQRDLVGRERASVG